MILTLRLQSTLVSLDMLKHALYTFLHVLVSYTIRACSQTTDCEITCSLQCETDIVDINCNYQQFTELPTSLPTITTCDTRADNNTDVCTPERTHTLLYNLYVSFNNITSVTSQHYYHSITILDISHNHLTHIADHALQQMTEMRELKLNNNYMIAISTQGWFTLWELTLRHNLENLQLADNPWSCSCDNVNRTSIHNTTANNSTNTTDLTYMSVILTEMSAILNVTFINVTCVNSDVSALLNTPVITLEERCKNLENSTHPTPEGGSDLPVYMIVVITLVVVYVVMISGVALCKVIRKRKPVAIEKYEIT